jgi:hypothetical protein
MAADTANASYFDSVIEVLGSQQLQELTDADGVSVKDLEEKLTAPGDARLKCFAGGKAGKVSLGAFAGNGCNYGLCTVFPNEGYSLPVFVSLWEDSGSEIRLLVDVMPTVDTLVHESNRVNFIEPFGELWNRFSKLPGICPEEDDELRAACSIVYTAARIPVEREGMRLAALAPHAEYLKQYMSISEQAAEETGDGLNDEVRRKTTALRSVLRSHFEKSIAPGVERICGDKTETLMQLFF